MTTADLDELTRRYLAATFDEIEDRLALDWTPGGLQEWGFMLNERCWQISGALADGDLSEVLDKARELAPAADERFQRKLARRMLEVQLEAGKAELKALSGEPLRRPRTLAATTQLAAPQAPQQATPLLSEIARMYAEERRAANAWSAKTAAQNIKIFEVIVDLLGDHPVGDYTKADVRSLNLQIPRLPANMTKKYPGMAPRAVLEKAGDNPAVDRLEPRSVNKYLQQARTLFKWAEEHDYITRSPATILKDVEEGRAQDARLDFTDDDIRALFAYIGKRPREPYGVWVPRIMAYTGCRMGEAAQLRRSDVRQEHDVWVFDINTESDQKNLKTDAAKRLVPVHPRLIELGLLEFVQGCTDEFLFPKRMRYTENSIRGNVDNLSKKLNGWLRSAGVKDKRKAFQSFRATFITRLKDKGVPDYQIAEIVGHENDNITSGRYGKRTNLATLRDIVSLVNLPI